MSLAGRWALALACVLLPRSAVAQDKRAPDEPFVRCIPCKNEGRVPCASHAKVELHLEDSVSYCSAVAGCATCGGTGWLDCTDCENPKWPEVLAKKRAQMASFAASSAKLDGEMKRPLRKVITPHFTLVWEVDEMKVDKRNLQHHELMHLYAERLERIFALYCDTLKAQPRDFKERTQVLVWSQLSDQVEASSRFAGQQSQRGVKLMGASSVYSVLGHKSAFKDDESLHRNIAHSVAHLLLAHQEPSQWIGNIKGGWADEGLAHWFEERLFGVCDNYCYEEQNTNVDFKGGRWKPVVRKMVATGDLAPLAEVLQQNTDGLKLPMHALSFSYVDYLIATDGAKFNQVCRDLRKRVAARDALQKHFGSNLIELEEKWKAWVLATYPVR
ncbi:MAG: hypothetical protein IT454_06975 [Planctomycetes bacterium]|nr:hypothetical protein [Planctomycetota bacterium]